ncbi:MAG: glycosyl hydrolase, partial [Sphingomonas sp.]|uniref:glycosyl hydrolase n=1 Tax=Sphingomonas sp. TaxID=28214 RepID=UPI003F7E1AD3
RFGHTATGARNVSAATAGIGLECDKFSAAALDFHFDTYFRELLPALERLGKRELAGVLIDSYETGMQNWTAELPREFEQRRGYALTRYMPALTGRLVADPETTERFLWDMRRLHAILMEDLYYGRFHDLCHQHGLLSYTEPYGNGPFDDQRPGAKVDRLMGEFWVRGGAAAYSVKVAATTAHVQGKTFVGAESFTGRPAQSRWQEHPYAMKGLGDEMYSLGLNHFVFHRYAQQPHPTARPGMTMGPWGFHFERTNTWFEEAGPWLSYATRCQHMLTSGNFAADILFFAGENSPVQCPVDIEEPIAATLSGPRPRLPHSVPAGHDYDVCGADVLHERARIEGNHIVLPDGMRYRVLVMPDDRRVTIETLAKIDELVRAGMWLVGPRVEHSHGLRDYPNNDAEVKRLASGLWGDLDGKARTSRTCGQGRVFWGMPLDRVLAEAGLAADVALSTRASDAKIHWIHRRTADADIYFVSNARRRPEELVATFRVAGRQPECWDPMTGKTHALPVYEQADGRTRVALRLDEAGSCFVVFRKPAAGSGAVALRGAGDSLLQTAAYPAAAREEAGGRFTVTAWIKPEVELWPISPDMAVPNPDPKLIAARAVALARGGSVDTLGIAGASFLLDPPAGDAVYGKGSATLALSAGRNGVIAYANAGDSYRAILAAPTPIAGWTHLALTADDGRTALFLDGKPIATGVPMTAQLHALLNVTINQPRLFEGDVAGLMLHKTVLDAAAIARLAAEPLPAPAEPPASDVAAGGLLLWRSGRYDLGDRRIDAGAIAPPAALAGPWQVSFPPDLGAPAGITLDRLTSLHRHADFGVRHFSGTATWRTRFAVPASALGGDRRLYLDLGRVEVIARVIVNGKPVGALWKPPFRLDVTDAVRAGENLLEVQVTNLWPNRLIGDEHFPTENDYSVNAFGWDGGIAALPDWYREGRPQPKGQRVAFATWKHYSADSPLLESGLLGPVMLRSARLIPLA